VDAIYQERTDAFTYQLYQQYRIASEAYGQVRVIGGVINRILVDY
jgi:hypothetical protein